MFISILINNFQSVHAQNFGTLKGTIYNEKGIPLSQAIVSLEQTHYSTNSDSNGLFIFYEIPYGSYKIQILLDDLIKKEQKIEVNTPEVTIDFKIKENKQTLDEVTIVSKTNIEKTQEQAYTVTAVDAKVFHNTNQDINQVLNKTAGVRVREEGGLGSGFNFSLNGFSGNQVKFFLDGVPMDNFGSSLSLNNIPINIADRIEVYKGVVPVWLGSDALGGAVNIVTNQKIKRFADVSYSFGSFNTHRIAVNSRYVHDSTGFTVNASAFYNYSDNNYYVDVRNPKKDASQPDSIRVRRFHDAYESATAQVEIGVTRKKIADKFLIGMIISGNLKEIQNGANMEKVVGEAFTTDQVFIPTLKYKKEDFLIDRLNFSLYSMYNLGERKIVDTSSRVYYWTGEDSLKIYGKTSGEISNKSLFQFTDRSALSTANLSYDLGKIQSLSLNYTYTYFSRQGIDSLSKYEAPFENPNIITKHIIGLSYKIDLLKSRWSTTLFGKSYRMNADVKYVNYDEEKKIDTYFNNFGAGIATTFFLTPSLQLKSSFENAYRLPEGYEMFGDGLLLLGNALLEPEKSKNFNAGLLANWKIKKHSIGTELGFIYRDSENLIRIQAEGITSHYINQRKANNTGVEGGIKYNYNKTLFFEVNATYQNIINTSKTEGNMISIVYLDRLPNIPYLFGNGSVGFQFKKVGFSHANLNINWSSMFIEQFYLKWPSMGSSKFNIPRQLGHNAGLTYSLKNNRYNISVECTNVMNSNLYDNFRLQKPGRAFSLKLRYFIN